MPPSDDPIILEPDRKIKVAGSDDPIILEPTRIAGSDDPIILEPDKKPDGPPITVQPVKVSWYKRWSTHLAGINFAAVVAFYAMLPDRMLDAIPAVVHGLIGVSLLATGLIPAATSVKQVKKVD